MLEQTINCVCVFLNKRIHTSTFHPFGKSTTLDLYSLSLVTLTVIDSSDLLRLLLSTAIPMLMAYRYFNPAASSSSNVNPRPSLSFMLYFMVGHRTIGLNLSTGLGASLAAFSLRRALRFWAFFG